MKGAGGAKSVASGWTGHRRSACRLTNFRNFGGLPAGCRSTSGVSTPSRIRCFACTTSLSKACLSLRSQKRKDGQHDLRSRWSRPWKSWPADAFAASFFRFCIGCSARFSDTMRTRPDTLQFAALGLRPQPLIAPLISFSRLVEATRGGFPAAVCSCLRRTDTDSGSCNTPAGIHGHLAGSGAFCRTGVWGFRKNSWMPSRFLPSGCSCQIWPSSMGSPETKGDTRVAGKVRTWQHGGCVHAGAPPGRHLDLERSFQVTPRKGTTSSPGG